MADFFANVESKEQRVIELHINSKHVELLKKYFNNGFFWGAEIKNISYYNKVVLIGEDNQDKIEKYEFSMTL